MFNFMIFNLPPKRQNLKKFLPPFLVVLFLDQSFKFIATRKMLLDLDFHKNSNALFGISINIDPSLIIFFAAILAVFFYFQKEDLKNISATLIVAAGLASGGVFSNLIDRFLYGYVIDYLALPNLFSFNIADLAIAAGTLILGWKVMIE